MHLCKIIAPKRRFFSMKKCYFLLFLFISIFLYFSCRKTEITPAYLSVSIEDLQNCINVENFNDVHGTNYDKEQRDVIKQQNFKDILVSINGTELGYWQLPCKIPLLPNYSGTNNVRITPCVRIVNSISLTTVQYTFVAPVEQTFNMEREGEYKLSNLKFEYVKGVSFPVLETFAQSTIFQSNDTIDGARMEISYNEELNKYVGKIALDNDSLKYFNVVTPYFPLKGHLVKHFLEMYYKCEGGEMTVSLNFQNTYSGAPPQDLAVLPSSKSWKKIYVDISEIIDLASGAAEQVSVRLYIQGNRNSNSKNAYFYFGNVKLISMPDLY